MTKQQLFDNRLSFISHHRDRIEKQPGLILCHSHFDYFKTAFLFDKEAIEQVPEKFTLHVVDWSGIAPDFPKSHGWEHTESMTFMELFKLPTDIQSNADLVIKRIQTESDIELFCQTQSKGFITNNEEADKWYPVLLAGAKELLGAIHIYFIYAILMMNRLA